MQLQINIEDINNIHNSVKIILRSNVKTVIFMNQIYILKKKKFVNTFKKVLLY
jgi:hypothetical protein